MNPAAPAGAARPLRVGVTGHRFLSERALLAAAVERALDAFAGAFPGRDLEVLSALAEGADRLAAAAALRRPRARLVAVLPLAPDDYAADFANPASRAEFEELLGRAAAVRALPPAASREAAYEAGGLAVLEDCDALLAVWDGQGAQGRGGTGAIVARARARGLPLAWVHAGNRRPGTTEPVSLGAEQGVLSLENFARDTPRPDAGRRRALRRFWREAQWPFVWGLALATVLLGCRGFARYAAAAGQARSTADLVYATLQLFVLELGSVEPPLPWELGLARFLAPLVGVYTATRALMVLFREQLQQLRARLRRGHVVVCGLGRKGRLVARAFRGHGEAVVAIERDDGNDDIEPCRDAGIPVFVGDARDPDLLRRAGVGRARLLVAVTGSDGVNAEITAGARDLCGGERRGPPLLCLVHLFDSDLCSLLREEELGGEHQGGVRLEFFNVFEAGGAQMAALVPWPAPGAGGRAPRLLVVGLGKLGECLVAEAARGWRARRPPGGAPLAVVLVDQAAEERRRGLELRHPWLASVCRLEAWTGDVRSPEFEQGPFAAAPLDAAFICLDDEGLALAAGLDLLRRLRGQGTPIVVRLAEEAGLARLLGGGRFAQLRGFGLLDRTCRPEVLLETSRERLARALHEDYLRSPAGAAGGAAAVGWERLAPEFQESSRAQADDIGRKLAAIGCELRRGAGAPLALGAAEVELLARLEHARWLEERRAAGWTHAPGPKDPERRTNPHLVPWEELAEEARETTRSAVRGLPEFLAAIGFEARRRAAAAERER